MGSMNISIKDEAYKFLKSLKTKDKSFSDIILEFKEKGIKKKGSKESVLKYWGVLRDADIDWDDVEKRRKQARESFERRISRR